MLVTSLSLLALFTSTFAGSPSPSLISPNWAGYVIQSDISNAQPVVAGVSGSWTVPEVSASTQDAFSAAWIGIGGEVEPDETLIQTGTEHDSINGQSFYSAWYELLPNDSVTIDSINLSPEDKITASIKLVDSEANSWSMEIADVTNGQRFQQTVNYNCSRLSAEWIVERPTVDHSLSALANFGSVTFTDANASTNTMAGAISSFSHLQVIMSNRQNKALVTVSSLRSNGSSFTVNYSSSVASMQDQLGQTIKHTIAVTPVFRSNDEP